jgi:hypothetical protein
MKGVSHFFIGRRNGRFLVCTCHKFRLSCVGLSTQTATTVSRQHVIRNIKKLFLEFFYMCTFMLGVTQKLSIQFVSKLMAKLNFK